MRKHKQDDQSTFSELSWGKVFALCTATLVLGTAFLWLSYQIDEDGNWVRGRLLDYPPNEDQAETIEKGVDALLLSTGNHALEVILGIHAIAITVAVQSLRRRETRSKNQ
jgi:heme/copper-type cytochrome/quinol oxidase subunit 3